MIIFDYFLCFFSYRSINAWIRQAVPNIYNACRKNAFVSHNDSFGCSSVFSLQIIKNFGGLYRCFTCRILAEWPLWKWNPVTASRSSRHQSKNRPIFFARSRSSLVLKPFTVFCCHQKPVTELVNLKRNFSFFHYHRSFIIFSYYVVSFWVS